MKSVTKAWVFLALLSLTLVVLGHSFGGREGLLTALILVLGINFFIYFYEDRRVLSLLGGQELEGQDSYGVHDATKRLTIKARIPMPKIIVLPNIAPQAAVVGRGISQGTLVLTQGCLDKFTRIELEAIIAYQIASIRSLNTLAFAVGSFISSIGLVLAESLDMGLRILIVEKKNPDTFISQLFTRSLSPLFGFILKISIRPSLYISADKMAAQLIGDPQVLARALWKLDSYSESIPFSAPLSTAHMFIVSPLSRYSWPRYYIAQPQPSRRVKNLIGYYPV